MWLVDYIKYYIDLFFNFFQFLLRTVNDESSGSDPRLEQRDSLLVQRLYGAILLASDPARI